jgi:hypothetical protein
MKRLSAVLLLAVVSAGAHAWPPPGPPDAFVPRGGTLEICTAQVDGDNVVLLWAGTRLVPEKRVVTRKVEGKDVQVEVTVAVPVVQQRKDKVALKEVRAFGGDGRPLPPEALAARLKQPTTVLTTHGGWLGNDAPFRGLLRDDAVVLLLPTPEKGPPPPPLPPEK